MIINVNEDDILKVAEIHSISWKKSHENICSKEFIEQHTIQHQKMYLCDEINLGKSLYMLIDDKPVGLVSVYETDRKSIHSSRRTMQRLWYAAFRICHSAV